MCRVYSWLCTLRPLLVVFRDYTGYQKSNWTQLCERRAFTISITSPLTFILETPDNLNDPNWQKPFSDFYSTLSSLPTEYCLEGFTGILFICNSHFKLWYNLWRAGSRGEHLPCWHETPSVISGTTPQAHVQSWIHCHWGSQHHDQVYDPSLLQLKEWEWDRENTCATQLKCLRAINICGQHLIITTTAKRSSAWLEVVWSCKIHQQLQVINWECPYPPSYPPLLFPLLSASLPHLLLF